MHANGLSIFTRHTMSALLCGCLCVSQEVDTAPLKTVPTGFDYFLQMALKMPEPPQSPPHTAPAAASTQRNFRTRVRDDQAGEIWTSCRSRTTFHAAVPSACRHSHAVGALAAGDLSLRCCPSLPPIKGRLGRLWGRHEGAQSPLVLDLAPIRPHRMAGGSCENDGKWPP